MLNRLSIYMAVLLASACTTAMYEGPRRPESEVAFIETEGSSIVIDGVGRSSSQIEVLPGEHFIEVGLYQYSPDYARMYNSFQTIRLCMRAEAGKRYVVRIKLDNLEDRITSWTASVLERNDTVVNGVIKARRNRDVTSKCSAQLAEAQRQFRSEQQQAWLYEKSCSDKVFQACFSLGEIYKEGHGVPQDVPRAATLFEKACAGGVAPGCNSLGLLYKEGRGVPKDESRAAGLYEKACTGGVAQGCFNLGVQYMQGRAISQDVPRAAALFENACTGGVAPACNNLGVLYKEGRGVPKDESRAAELFKMACQGGMPSACASP